MLLIGWVAACAAALGAWSAASVALTAAYVGVRWLCQRGSARRLDNASVRL